MARIRQYKCKCNFFSLSRSRSLAPFHTALFALMSQVIFSSVSVSLLCCPHPNLILALDPLFPPLFQSPSLQFILISSFISSVLQRLCPPPISSPLSPPLLSSPLSSHSLSPPLFYSLISSLLSSSLLSPLLSSLLFTSSLFVRV